LSAGHILTDSISFMLQGRHHDNNLMSLDASDTLLLLLCRAPLSFFHVTPTGRIINRLTKDTSDVDKNLADFAAFFLRSCLQLTSTIILVGVTTPFALPFLVPILLLFYFLYQYFQVGSTTRWSSLSPLCWFWSCSSSLCCLQALGMFL